MIVKRRIGRAAACVISLTGACYTYTSIDPSAAVVGEGVRARITAPAATRLAPLLGTGETRVLTGKLVENGGNELIIEVPAVVEVGVGSSMQSLYQRVSIAKGEVVELEARKLDKLKTGALVAAGVAVVGGVVVKAASGGRGKEPLPGGGSTDSRIPVP
jgi:hypothetical protein